MRQKIMLLLGAALVLSACANTREPNAVAARQANDFNLTCAQMAGEYRANTQVAKAKIKKNEDDDGRDLLLGVLIWPGLADFKNADGIEGNALLDRNIHLQNLAVQKVCNRTTWPPQPARYT